MLGFDFIMRNY